MKKAIMFALILLTTSGVYGQYCDPPGDFVGITDYYTQGYGSSAQRIAIDSMGGIHVAWTGSPEYPPNRNVYYNFKNETTGDWLDPYGVQVDPVNSAGFASLALLSSGEAAVAYHNIMSGYAGLSMDAFRGFGIFSYYDVPDLLPNGSHGFWPQVAISANGDIHVLITEHAMGGGSYTYLAYTRSEDGGTTWTTPAVVDSVATQISTIVASPTGEVAIVYLKPTDLSEYQLVKNDVCYIESSDGRTWDFRFPVNITDYLNDNDDIFCPWGQDAVYDNSGNLNVVWTINNIGMDGSFIDDATALCYYSQGSGSIEVIAQMTDTDLSCDPGPMNSLISMPNISIRENGDIAVAYTGFTDSDVSVDNFCVGDIYLVLGSASQNTWIDAGNITETHTPNCSGDCESEEFPSLSETMRDSTYLTYVMRNHGDNPDTVYYLPVNVPNMTGVGDDDNIPYRFMLKGNYPNPFNAQTTIEFTLGAKSNIELTIYDITGAKVMAVERAGLGAGQHSITWDAGDVASGVYFARLETEGYSSSIKMVLLK